LNISATNEAEQFPSSLVLYVSYIFPYDAVIQSITQNSELSPTDRKQLLMRLSDEAGKKIKTIIKALPVYGSGENS
jgi:hypothetical protein